MSRYNFKSHSVFAIAIALLTFSFAVPSLSQAQETKDNSSPQPQTQDIQEKTNPPCPTQLLFYHMGIYYYETQTCPSPGTNSVLKGFTSEVELGCANDTTCNEGIATEVVSVSVEATGPSNPVVMLTDNTPSSATNLPNKIPARHAERAKALLMSPGATSFLRPQFVFTQDNRGEKAFWVLLGVNGFNVARQFDSETNQPSAMAILDVGNIAFGGKSFKVVPTN